VLLLLVAPATSYADIAVMARGKLLHIEQHTCLNNKITLFLKGGGEVTVPSNWVADIVSDEIVDRDEDIEKMKLLPSLELLIRPVAIRYGLDPELVAAVIWMESGGNPTAVSRKGAKGLMQLMPETAQELGVKHVLDPKQNVEGGVRYLRTMLDSHGGDLSLALAAYNAGPTVVKKYAGVPPYRETQDYIQKILQLYNNALQKD